MKAVQWEKGCIRTRDVPRPSGEGVRVRIASAGICGSDLHAVGCPESPLYRDGVTLGHELAGVTSNGVPVMIDPLSGCGVCDRCVDGNYNMCRLRPDVFGITKNGGMAEEIIVPERAIVRLPVGLDPRDACVAEPIGVALHGLKLAGLDAGKRVAIVGGGVIGLSAAAVAVNAGCEVFLAARYDHQREVAERIGAKLEHDGEYDIVVDAAGSASSIDQCVDLARPGADMALLAVYWDGFAINMSRAMVKEVVIRPSLAYNHHGAVRDLDMAAVLLGKRPELAGHLITHRFPLDAAEAAFEAAASRKSGAIKVVFNP
jgi:2-desacetyl-2-hydroxyethyl bacteriochlorophyllide A dehydrogenase